MAASTGRRARPDASLVTRRMGATDQRQGHQREQGDGRSGRVHRAGHRQEGPHQHAGEREQDAPDVAPAGAAATHPHGQGVLARAPVGVDVPQVVGQQQGGGQQADGRAANHTTGSSRRSVCT